MGAPILTPTQAEQDLFRSFALARESFSTREAAERQKAFDRFASAGLPTRRVESWHYTDLRAKLRQAPPISPAPDEASKDSARKALENFGGDTLKLVLVDGFFVAEISDDFSKISGVKIRHVSSLSPDDSAAEILRGLAGPVEDPVLDLNAAFACDGVAVEIDAGARLEKPIEIVSLCGATAGQSRFSRNLVILGEGARATLIETRAEGGEGFGDSALFLSLGEKSELDYACRAERSAAVETQTFVARLASQAQLRAASLIAGASFLRRQLFVSCVGEKAEIHLAGAALLKGREHADVTLNVTHDAPACISRETYKYVLAEQANGVFQGKIVVPPHAQKTDGKMLCRGLLLSEDAAMSSKPELEIFADDVACGHGAACSKLDAAQLFYMESRGIPKEQAQAILVEAFAGEAFDILRDESLRDLLSADLKALLHGGVFA